MRHGLKGRKFGRYSAHRKSMLMNLTKSLIEHEQINTTLPKAKDLKSVAEKIITLGKKGTLHARRQAIAFFGGKNGSEVTKLFDVVAERYKDRNGGYTRVLKNGYRKGDSAPMAIIELV